MLFVSDIYRYVPIPISNVSRDISLFKLKGVLNTDSIMLRKKFTWNTLEIDGSQEKMLLINERNKTTPHYANILNA